MGPFLSTQKHIIVIHGEPEKKKCGLLMVANPLSGAETTELQSFLYPVNNTSLRTNSKFIELPVISLS